jgi:hypothetical protein
MPPDRAAVVQGDRSVLLEVDHPDYERARELLARCAEIEKSPEHVPPSPPPPPPNPAAPPRPPGASASPAEIRTTLERAERGGLLVHLTTSTGPRGQRVRVDGIQTQGRDTMVLVSDASTDEGRAVRLEQILAVALAP